MSEESSIGTWFQKGQDKIRPYQLRPFRAVIWTGDNIDEVDKLLRDPDTGYEIVEKEYENGFGSCPNVIVGGTNDYLEPGPHYFECWPGDYLVSWGDYYRVFNHRFFREMFMLDPHYVNDLMIECPVCCEFISLDYIDHSRMYKCDCGYCKSLYGEEEFFIDLAGNKIPFEKFKEECLGGDDDN